jgi:uncharacterized protein YkwD
MGGRFAWKRPGMRRIGTIRGPVPGLLTATAAVSAALATAAPPAAPAAAASCPEDAAVPGAIVCRINAARAARHVPPLRSDARLAGAARRYAIALGTTGPLTHALRGTGSPERRIEAGGYGGRRGVFDFAEVLGRSSGGAATPDQRTQDWLRDTPIRRSLVSRRFRDVGVGSATAGDTTTYVLLVAVTVTSAQR